MVPNAVQLLGVLLTAVSMAAGFTHLLELPNKLHLSRDDYLTVQQIYRGWAWLGAVVLAALVSTLTLAVMERRNRTRFRLTVAAAGCTSLGLAVFFTFTLPANRQTLNWATLPDNWEGLRRQWEYSHAVGAGLYFVALTLLTVSLLDRTRSQGRAGRV